MSISATSRAAAVGASVKNVQHAPGSVNVPRKINVIGTYLSTMSGITDGVPVLVSNPEDAASKFGPGSMIHRLVKAAYRGSNGVETWVSPQAEAGGAAAAAGSILFGGPATANGTIHMYIAGDYVPVNVSSGDAADAICTKAVEAITANLDLPVAAIANIGTPAQMDVSAKSKGPWGNSISLTFNHGFGEVLPAGVTTTVTPLATGAGVPDVTDVLDAWGTGKDANEDYFTDVVHGYGGMHTATLNLLSTYNGLGNEASGCYGKLVGRPFRVLAGDVSTGSSGLAALIAFGDGRRASDRTNGIICVPGSPNHPDEIAAVAIGTMARISNDRPEQNYNGLLLAGVIPGARGSDRWTSEYSNANAAVTAGVSPTEIVSGAVYMMNVQTFYHPVTVPVDSNGYASMRNIAILQNILYNLRANFSQEKWKGVSIVQDVAKVSSMLHRQKARDTGAVLDDLIALAIAFEGRAWLYTAAFTISELARGRISIRAGATGFDAIFPIILSGDCVIIDVVAEFDTSLAALGQ
jgi:phage tail sheath gpL-like